MEGKLEDYPTYVSLYVTLHQSFVGILEFVKGQWFWTFQANHGGVKGKLPSESPLEQTQPDPEKEGGPDSEEEGEETEREEREVLNRSEDEDEVSKRWTVVSQRSRSKLMLPIMISLYFNK